MWIKKTIKAMPLLAIPAMFFGRVLSGFHTYRHILRECPYGESWNIYFMDYAGSGDTYLSCAYLQARGRIGSHDAFAAAGGLSLKIARMFDFGHFVEIDPHRALTVRMMERFYGKRLKILPLLYESDYLEYSGVMRFMAGYRGLDFMSMLKIGFEANCGLPYDETPWIQPEFPYEQAELDALFRKYQLMPGKTVLLAPYAGKHGLWGIPMEFYEELARQLCEKGFIVCTNTCGMKEEPPVPGTVPVLVPHQLMRPFCEQAGCFIGLRSGLCDIISAARNCKKIIFSGTMVIPSVIASHQTFFSLKNMGLCKDAIELGYPDGQHPVDQIIERFLRDERQKKLWDGSCEN